MVLKLSVRLSIWFSSSVSLYMVLKLSVSLCPCGFNAVSASLDLVLKLVCLSMVLKLSVRLSIWFSSSVSLYMVLKLSVSLCPCGFNAVSASLDLVLKLCVSLYNMVLKLVVCLSIWF